MLGNKERMTTISILQPHYLPWTGYFNLIARSDIFVFLNDVEFTVGEWKNRNKIRKTSVSKDTKWLSVPVGRKNHFSLLMNCDIADQNNWREKHLRSIYETYKKAPFFEMYFFEIEKLLTNRDLNILSHLNIKLIDLFCTFFSIDTKKVLSSDLDCEGDKHSKPLMICKKLNCDRYLATSKSSEYIEIEEYELNNISVEFQNFNHKNYDQFYDGEKLEPINYLSVLDLLFNQGPESKKYII